MDKTIEKIRNNALEEAARLSASLYKKGQIGSDIAAAIRELKTND